MYRISKQFEFSAAHQLLQLPDGHPCKRMHGHNYVVTFILEGEDLDRSGFVQDYRELAPVKEWLDQHFDHQYLNDKMEFPPTAENIARYLYTLFHDKFTELVEVQVSETPKTNASYRP